MSAIDDLARDGILDTRDIDERIDALQEGAIDRDEDAADELAELLAFRDSARPYCADWEYGETIIAEWAFRDYAEQLAEDIGAIDRDATWPLSYIDWDGAADALKIDYTAVEDAAGGTWWTR